MSDTSRIRVVIADDYAVVREGVTAIIDRTPDMSVVAEADSWPQAIQQVLDHRPNVALLDLRMPGMTASDAVVTLHDECAEVGIVLLSAFDADDEVYGAIRSGARGFLLKDCTCEELRDCIRAVHQGNTWLARGPAAKLAERVHTPALTRRQIQILRLVTEGKTNKEVGALLNVTEGTVKVHVNHIFGKLGVANRTAAITKALQRGIVFLSQTAQGPDSTHEDYSPSRMPKDVRPTQANSELNPKS
ncbi:MAG: response regulator transcription factor [Candidatus Acidiferrum sp.]